MARHKITALQDVAVCAFVWFESPAESQTVEHGAGHGKKSRMQNAEKKFILRKGESRDDIAFLVDVGLNANRLYARRIELPDGVGRIVRDGDFLLIERVE